MSKITTFGPLFGPLFDRFLPLFRQTPYHANTNIDDLKQGDPKDDQLFGPLFWTPPKNDKMQKCKKPLFTTF